MTAPEPAAQTAPDTSAPPPRRAFDLRLPQDWRLDATTAFRIAVIGGFLLMLAANMPGQLSYDSIVQLHEGRHHIRETWAPAILSAILGAFDAVIPGTGLYLVASGLLAYGALLALRTLRPTMSWAGPAVALITVLLPTLLIFQGNIWKDILFANLTLAGFVLLAHVGQIWDRGRVPWLALLGALVTLAAAAQVRQNGVVAAVVAALVMAWFVRSGGWRASLGWGAGGLVATLLVSQALGVVSLPPSARGHDKSTAQGMMVLQRYDIIGALAHDPGLQLTDIRAASPEVEQLIRVLGVPLYTPERVDYLAQDPRFAKVFSRVPKKAVATQWRHIVLNHPRAYLAQRLDAFRWVFMTPEIDSCLPIYVGIDGPIPMVKDLNLQIGVSPPAQSLYNYGTYFLDSPAFSHLTYAVLALAIAGVLLWRREPQDVAIAGLMVTALGFSASFFLISIACDYRYLYLLDLAAMTGLIYLAIDPPFPRPRSKR